MVWFIARTVVSGIVAGTFLYPVGLFVWLDAAWWDVADIEFRRTIAGVWAPLTFFMGTFWHLFASHDHSVE